MVSNVLSEEEADPARHLIGLNEQQDENPLSIRQLLRGKPIVGVVAKGESRLVHFGVLEYKGRFPDITISLQGVDPLSKVQLYCAPRRHLGARVVPSARTAQWTSTNAGQVFISAKSLSYQDSIMDTVLPRTRLETQVARFSCAVYGASSTVSKFQLTMRLSFNQRTLVASQESAMRVIYDECCMKEGTCKGWRTSHLVGQNSTDEVEFDFCHRTGSICNVDGELRRLGLKDYGLECKLPVKALLNLTTLESLDLSDNKISANFGREVVSLGALDRLSDLNLASNLISGDLSVVGVCSTLLSHLVTLDLDNNYITGRIPPCLFSSTSAVKEVYLSRNRIRGTIPDVFSASSTLKALSMSENKLIGTVPVTLGRLKSLEVLYLNQNNLDGVLPSSFSELESLEAMDLSGNHLTKLPITWSTNWRHSKNLVVLKLQDNKFKGQLPTKLIDASSLELLDLSSNEFNGPLFSKKGMFPNIRHLNLSRNNLRGKIPEDFASLGLFGPYKSSELRHELDLSFNRLSGDLPEFIYQENSPDVVDTAIYLEGNNLTCHKWMKLNYIPNFECGRQVSGMTVSEKDAEFFESEKDIRNQLDAIDQTSLLSSTSDEKDKTNVPVVIIIAGVGTAMVLVGSVVLVVTYLRRRERTLGMEYDIAGDTSMTSGDETQDRRQETSNAMPEAEIEP